jgi:hypothetical protein
MYSITCEYLKRAAGLTMFLALSFGSASVALAVAPDFGSPPSGEVPILFNDHTVYAAPDILKQGRVLAALVKDGQIYVPLRSMFEQMGADVSVSADGNTYTVTQGSISASVTVGQNKIEINGVSRPLDVAPMIYHGVVLVPVRVLSEALGAYVAWVPGQRVVVVRYIPATPPPVATPSVAPTAEPAMAPAPVPTPAPTAIPYNFFVQGAISWPKVYNAFSDGTYCHSFQLNGVLAPAHSRFAAKVDYRQDSYVTSDNRRDVLGNEFTNFSTIDGGTASTPVFLATQSSLDARFEYEIADPRIYLGVGYVHTANSYGDPQLNGIGVGVEKLPDLHPGISVYGSAFYYPNASGNYTVESATSSNAGKTYQQEYQIWKLDIGLAIVLGRSPLYLYGGYGGDQYLTKKNAPIGQTLDGPYLGLGLKL